MNKIKPLLVLLCLCPVAAFAQTTDESNADGKNPNNVITQSMGYDRKSYSPLKQITRSNVKKLVPVWNAALSNEQGELAAPTVYDGVMYVINGRWTFAIDVETGRQLWRTPVKLEPGITREAITRGAATIYNGKSAPIVANGVVISGMAGGESTTRGFLIGWDPETGKKLWTRYTIPAPGEPGSETWPKNSDAWMQGGGPTWLSV